MPTDNVAVKTRRSRAVVAETLDRPDVAAKSTRRTYTFAPETLDRLEVFANARGIKEGEIIRDALQLYDYVYRAQIEARQKNRDLNYILLDTGDPSPARIMVPQLSRELAKV